MITGREPLTFAQMWGARDGGIYRRLHRDRRVCSGHDTSGGLEKTRALGGPVHQVEATDAVGCVGAAAMVPPPRRAVRPTDDRCRAGAAGRATSVSGQPALPARQSSRRSQSGSGTDFWMRASVHTTVAPPSQATTPGWSVRSSVMKVSKLLRPGLAA